MSADRRAHASLDVVLERPDDRVDVATGGRTRRSMLIAASSGLGRSASTCSALGLHGDIARVPARRWSALASCGPWRSISRAGRQQDDHPLVEAPFAQVSPVGGLRAGDEQQRGCTLSSTPLPMSPKSHDDDGPAHEHRHGVANGEAGDRRDQPSGLAIRCSMPGATDVPSLIVRGPNRAVRDRP